MKTIGIVVLITLLGGCATCREHPVACAASALVVGAIAAHELDHHRNSSARTINPQGSPCTRVGSVCPP